MFFHVKCVQSRRNRASPARLIKLYEELTGPQRKMIRDINFDGLLQIQCSTIPARFTNRLLVHCFDPETSEPVLPWRGRIPVTTDSVANIFRLPNKGGKVRYEFDVDAINFMQSKFSIIQGSALKIEQVLEMVKQNKNADEDFLRCFLMIAISTFLCPPTSLEISPRCYPTLVDLSAVKGLNWCQFVVDQLKVAAMKINKKNSVKGCVLLLVVCFNSVKGFFQIHQRHFLGSLIFDIFCP